MSEKSTIEIKKKTKSSYNLTSQEQEKCHAIIHSASIAATGVGAGLAQLPLADNAVITPIQITMIISLGKVFNQTITKSVARGLLGGFVANFVGRGVAQAVWGWIPGVGNATNAVTAAAITETVGWLSVDYFYKNKYVDSKHEDGKQGEMSNGELHSLGFCKIVKTCEVVKEGRNGYLVWDCAIVNEISFVDQITHKIESLHKGWSDEKTEEKFKEFSLKYAVENQEYNHNTRDKEDMLKETWKSRAEEFISGKKSRVEDSEDYQKLLYEYDDMSYMWSDENDELVSVYDKLLLVK